MKKYFLSFLIAACIVPAAMNAQSHRDPPHHRALERLESLKKVRLMESLKLDEKQSVKLFARYNKHREIVHSFEAEAGELYKKLEGQIAANASDAELNQTVSAVLECDRKRYDARSKFVTELRDVLTTKQIAEYVVFERNFARELREAVRDVKMERLKTR